MANIFNTARYILQRQGTVSTMKLQKLCYYAQAWALVWDDQPLFDEDFQAWKNGPVCPELFDVHRGRYSVSEEDIPIEYTSEPELTDEQRNTIDNVLDFYGKKNAQWLSQLTHMEDPWKNARAGLSNSEPSTMVISKADMAEYYGGL